MKTIIIKSKEIKAETISEAITEIDNNPEISNKVARIAALTNKGCYDVAEAVANHIVMTDEDYIFNY